MRKINNPNSEKTAKWIAQLVRLPNNLRYMILLSVIGLFSSCDSNEVGSGNRQSTAKKMDLMKQYSNYYSSKESPELVEIEKAKYISIHAKGSFREKIFIDRIEALTNTAYALKHLFDNSDKSFEVPVLEGQYWYDQQKYGLISISRIFDTLPLAEIEYRILIRIPEYINSKDIEKAKLNANTKYKELLASIEFYEQTEGKCVQMLHLGPFKNEGKSLKEIEDYVNKNQMVKNGLHHEVYLVDFTKMSQDSLRTILREPVT